MDVQAILSGRRKGFSASLLRCLTWSASKPYGLIVAGRNRCFDRQWKQVYHVPVPVISVGNITTGGTGKTPVVAWLARYLRAKGLRVSLVSRGYGATDSGLNDEALELEDQLPDVPHVQNPDRVAAARVAVEELEAEVILLDDGFQHRRLHRDLNIVLIDATNPFGYGHLLPRGLLREHVSGLARADVILLTRSDSVDAQRCAEIRNSIQRWAPSALWVESIHAPSHLRSYQGNDRPTEWIRDRPVLAVCAIGNPDAFSQTIAKCGGKLAARKAFPDHHQFDRHDMNVLSGWANDYKNVDCILCTHKDLVKLRTDCIGNLPLFALSIAIRLQTGENELLRIVDTVVTPHRHD